MTTLTWLHLSDWHQEGKLLSRANVVQALIADIKDRASISPQLAHLDFIIFSGDLAFSGKPEEYDAALSQLLEPLLQVTGVPKERLFLIPGNHDIERKYVMGPSAVQQLNGKELVHAVVSDSRRLGQFLETQGSYKAFVQKFLGEERWPEPRWGWSHTFEVKGQTIGIAGLNSAWLCGYNLDSQGVVDDDGHLVVSEKQVQQALAGIADAQVRFAIMHHPFEWLVPFESRRIKNMLLEKCHFILTGHVHWQNVMEVREPSGDAVFVPAGSAYDKYQDPEYTNSYNFVGVDLQSGRGEAFFRRWSEKQQKFVTDVDTSATGSYEFSLPKALGKGQSDESKPPPEPALRQPFSDDIQSLKDSTRLFMPALADFSTLYVGATQLTIEREVVRCLIETPVSESIVVVGEPGAGKSGALYQLVRHLNDGGRDVVLLMADRLNADSQGSLRNDLRLQHDLVDVLLNWSGEGVGYLVLDALDAARSVLSLRTYIDVVGRLKRAGSRWRVVVSIRKFDLRYNRELQDLFTGSPPIDEFKDPEFSHVKHINVPVMSDHELDNIRQLSSELGHLLSATTTLTALLRNPFNLRLAGLIVGHGIQVGDLIPVTTQVELLSRYWHHRVIKDDHEGDAREELLRRAAGRMLHRRSLNAARSDILNGANGEQLKQLLSAGVLVEWQTSPQAIPDRYLVAFSHHVLFDYAVSRLILHGDPEEFMARLIAEPELLLAIRPSITMYFQDCWVNDPSRKAFWELALSVTSNDEVNLVSKVVGPAVAAELAHVPEDIAPIVSVLEGPPSPRRVAAENVLRHTVWALGASHQEGSGTDWVKAWSVVAEKLSLDLSENTALILRFLLGLIKDQEALQPDDLRVMGAAARRLLSFALSQPETSPWLVLQGIQLVCRTLASDTAAGREALASIFDDKHWSTFGHLEITVLADEVPRLAKIDPDLTTALYVRAFQYDEQSRDTTSIGGSRILPLSSNRKQDYEVGRYVLAERFKSFLRVDQSAAVRCLTDVLQIYAQRQHWAEPAPVPPTFDYRGRSVQLLADDSEQWDDDHVYDHDEPVMMLNAFTEYAKEISSRCGEDTGWHNLIDSIGLNSQSAAVWRRLFRVAADCTNGAANELLPVASAETLLTSRDTARPMANWLHAIFPTLHSEERARIEEIILSIPDDIAFRERSSGMHVKEILLDSLPPEALVSEDAKIAHAALKPKAPPTKRAEAVIGHPEIFEDDAGDEDADTQAVPPQAWFRQLARHQNLTAEEIREVLPHVQAVWTRLQAEGQPGIDDGYRVAWVEVTRACSIIACSSGFVEVLESIDLIRSVLLCASSFAESRQESVDGLAHVLIRNGVADGAVISAFESLTRDPAAPVRLAAARNLFRLNACCSDKMWALIAERIQDESDMHVLVNLVSSLNQLLAKDAASVVKAVKQLLTKAAAGHNSSLLREACTAPLLHAYLFLGDSESEKALYAITDNPEMYPGEVRWIAGNSRFALTHELAGADSQAQLIRQRGWALLRRILNTAMASFRRLQATLEADQSPSDDVRATLTGLMQIVDWIGDQVYYASGALYEKDIERRTDERPLSPHEKRRFLMEGADLVAELADVGLASVTHHLLETLESLIEVDPNVVLRDIGRVVVAGKSGGYQYESLAVGVFVRVVDRYLAEFRHILRDDPECQRIILRMLDMFVEVGWIDAHRLVYRLEEVYR